MLDLAALVGTVTKVIELIVVPSSEVSLRRVQSCLKGLRLDIAPHVRWLWISAEIVDMSTVV